LRRNKSEVKSKRMTETNEVAFSSGVVVLTFFFRFSVFRFLIMVMCSVQLRFRQFFLIHFTAMSSQNSLLTVLNTC
jgi:hypothetical protein